ncbi:putative Endonuclease/exonuclease/phosphatase superfamily [Helianthus anomalus]
MWSDLSSRINPSDGQWILAGDFNAVRSPEERKHSKYKPVCAENFNNFIYNNGLLEYPMQGRRFTCIKDNGKKLSKLGCFLDCSEFFNKWSSACVRVMPSRHSDHCPTILELVDLNFGPRPFRVFNFWIGKPGFEEAVKAVVEDFEPFDPPPPPDSSLTTKFARIRSCLKSWRDEFLVK